MLTKWNNHRLFARIFISAEKMAKIIENADLVEVLELRGNTVGVGAGQRLAHALERHPELKVILHCEEKQTPFLIRGFLTYPTKNNYKFKVLSEF